MKRSRSPSPSLREDKHHKSHQNEHSSCWDLLPPELHARIFLFLSSHHSHHSYLLVSREWNELFFRSINSLNLVRYSAYVNDNVLRTLSENCLHVQKLTMGKIGVNMPITEPGMGCLSNFAKLQTLNLIACTLSCSTIKTLARHLSFLVSLNMTWCTIPDDCVEHFALFKQLKHLSLQDSQISDAGLIKLEELRQISSLNFSFCSAITDRGVIQIVRLLKNIESLNLSWCAEITDLSLLHIGTQLHKLKILYLTGCRKISMDGKNFIRRNLPECKVYSDSNFIPFKRNINM